MLKAPSVARTTEGRRIKTRSAETVRASRLVHIETATNRYRLPRGSRRKIACEINRQLRNFLRLDHPFYCAPLNRARVECFDVHPETLRDFADTGRADRPSRPSWTRADHVASDSILTAFERERAAESDYAVLGRRVCAEPRDTLQSCDRRDIHDSSVVALDHMRQDRLGEIPGAVQIQRDVVEPALIVHLEDRAMVRDVAAARVIHEDVDTAERAHRGVDHRDRVSLVGHIGALMKAPAPELLHLRRDVR